MPKPEINLKMIEADLAELAGNVPVKVKQVKTGIRLLIIENDKRTIMVINPNKVKTQQQLDEVLAECRNTLMIRS